MGDHQDNVDPTGIEEILGQAAALYDASTDGTLGVEEEFAIVDPVSLDLAQRYEDVEAAAQAAGLEAAVCGELIASEVEFRTGKCDTFADAISGVREYRAGAVEVMNGLGLQLGALGVHPWADYREQRIIESPYYQRLVDRLQFPAHRNNTFGLHVHVGVHGADRAIAVCDRLREWVPELLALSSSSPFFEGRDTGMSSMRAIVFGRLFPRAGLPPVHGTWEQYESMVRTFRNTNSIESYGQMWWHIRPHAIHGTIELRMFDAQPDPADTLALVALTAGLVAHLCDEVDDDTPFHPTPHHLLDENLWRAIRYGLQGELVDYDPELTQPLATPTTERVGELLAYARASNAAKELGLDEGLDRAEAMLQEGGRTAVLRSQFLETGDLAGVYRSVVEQTMQAPVRTS